MLLLFICHLVLEEKAFQTCETFFKCNNNNIYLLPKYCIIMEREKSIIREKFDLRDFGTFY